MKFHVDVKGRGHMLIEEHVRELYRLIDFQAKEILELKLMMANSVAAKPVIVDAGGMTEVVAELVKCRDMKGSEWFDVKVFDKTLPNGTKLCVATPPTESTGAAE